MKENETVKVNTMEFDGKEFFEVDVIDSGKNKYDYFAEINNPENIKIFKIVDDNGEEYLENLEGLELVEAFKLFSVKYN